MSDEVTMLIMQSCDELKILAAVVFLCLLYFGCCLAQIKLDIFKVVERRFYMIARKV